MRSKFVVLVGMLCLLASVASAEISRISPSSFTPSGEDYLTIFGSDLSGTVATQIIFDGLYTVEEPNFASPTEIVSWIPGIVLTEEGQHSVVVRSIDAIGVRVHGPAFFTVAAPQPSGPPTVFVPEGGVIVEAQNVDGALVDFFVFAVSANGADVPVTCTHPSGSQFPLGVTRVQCSAADAGGMATEAFAVFVNDTTRPEITVPDDIESETAIVTFTASAVDDLAGTLAVTCTPPSGSTFPVGRTRVVCTAVDNFANSATNSFIVHVTKGPPLLVLPADISEQATGPDGAIVTYEVSLEGGGTVGCVPPSGSLFAIGTTLVTCTASNPDGTATGNFNVIVEDTLSPVLSLPADLEVQATSASGAIVAWTATAMDVVDGVRPVTCTPVSGSQFALGTTTVLCSASDTRGNTGDGSFNVTVVEDSTPPVLTLPAGVRVEATSPSGAIVPYTASAVDAIDGVVPISCTPASGSQFAIGTTTVVCTASDTRGNTASGSFSVIVEDTTPPEIVSVNASPNTLWPPNHQMVNVTVTVVAVDTADSAPVSRIMSVSSNQPVNGTGDGDTAPDWQVTGPLTVQLRSERAGSADRLYTIVVECTDASGNVSSKSVTVRVTNGNSKSRAVR